MLVISYIVVHKELKKKKHTGNKLQPEASVGTNGYLKEGPYRNRSVPYMTTSTWLESPSFNNNCVIRV
jgi:hypothetical protein